MVELGAKSMLARSRQVSDFSFALRKVVSGIFSGCRSPLVKGGKHGSRGLMGDIGSATIPQLRADSAPTKKPGHEAALFSE